VFRRTLAAVSCLTAAGCATPSYQEVDASAPHATLIFEKGYTTGVGPGATTSQLYNISENAECVNALSAAAFSWGSGDTETRRVPADQQVT
jgi:hypothetical protein